VTQADMRDRRLIKEMPMSQEKFDKSIALLSRAEWNARREEFKSLYRAKIRELQRTELSELKIKSQEGRHHGC
jgi:hypothetical protein